MTQVNNLKNSSEGDRAAALVAELGQITSDSINNDEEARHTALELSKKLTATLEGPVNRATELVFKVPTLLPFAKTKSN